jgi:hypothetical protein
MGFFRDLFGGGTPGKTVTQGHEGGKRASPAGMIAFYYIATDIIPERVFRDENHPFTGGRRFVESIQSNPAPVIFELMTYAALSSEGRRAVPQDDMCSFTTLNNPICGKFGNQQYLIVQYPTPQTGLTANGTPIVGPIYSAFVYSEEDPSVRYYVLRTTTTGTSEIGVIRQVLPDKAQLTISTKCPTNITEFTKYLERIETTTKTIVGGVDKDGNPSRIPLELILRYFPDACSSGNAVLNNMEGELIIPGHWRPTIPK